MRPYEHVKKIQELIDKLQPACPKELEGRNECEQWCPHVEQCEAWKELRSLFRDPFIVCCCGKKHKDKCLFGKEGDALFGSLVELLTYNRAIVVVLARLFDLTHY